MNEEFPDDARVIDFTLAHVPKDKVEAAYNRAKYLTRRHEFAQARADKVLEGFKLPVELLVGRCRQGWKQIGWMALSACWSSSM